MIPFAQYCLQVEEHIKKAYGIAITTRDIPNTLTGDLNGAEIHIDEAVTAEQKLFLLAHLFGHTVQWNTSEKAYELGQPRKPPVSADSLPELMEYEREAARYGLGLLHEIGIEETDQWFADYSACDGEYLRHFYVTGEKKEFLSFWRNGSKRMDALVVPQFTPIVRAFRSDGIVI